MQFECDNTRIAAAEINIYDGLENHKFEQVLYCGVV